LVKNVLLIWPTFEKDAFAFFALRNIRDSRWGVAAIELTEYASTATVISVIIAVWRTTKVDLFAFLPEANVKHVVWCVLTTRASAAKVHLCEVSNHFNHLGTGFKVAQQLVQIFASSTRILTAIAQKTCLNDAFTLGLKTAHNGSTGLITITTYGTYVTATYTDGKRIKTSTICQA
jgi:hypothetical protein